MGHCESHFKHFPGKIFKMWSRTLIIIFDVNILSVMVLSGYTHPVQIVISTCVRNIIFIFSFLNGNLLLKYLPLAYTYFTRLSETKILSPVFSLF